MVLLRARFKLPEGDDNKSITTLLIGRKFNLLDALVESPDCLL